MPEPQVSDKVTIPVNTSFTPITTSDGAEIVPPDNPEAESQTSLEDDLFRFKVRILTLLLMFTSSGVLGTGQSHLRHSSKQV